MSNVGSVVEYIKIVLWKSGYTEGGGGSRVLSTDTSILSPLSLPRNKLFWVI